MATLDINWLVSDRGRKFALSARKVGRQLDRGAEDDNDRIFYANQNCAILYIPLPGNKRTYVLKTQPLNSEWPEYRLLLTPQQVQDYLDHL